MKSEVAEGIAAWRLPLHDGRPAAGREGGCDETDFSVGEPHFSVGCRRGSRSREANSNERRWVSA
jgi:hypothetical protein